MGYSNRTSIILCSSKDPDSQMCVQHQKGAGQWAHVASKDMFSDIVVFTGVEDNGL